MLNLVRLRAFVFSLLLVLVFASVCSAQQPRVLWEVDLFDEAKVKNDPEKYTRVFPVVSDVDGDSLPEIVIGLKHWGQSKVILLSGYDGSTKSSFALDARVYSLCVVRDGNNGTRKLATGLLDGCLCVYDLGSGTLLSRIDHGQAVYVVSSDDINADGVNDYAVISEMQDMAVYDGKSEKRLWGYESCKYVFNVAIDDVDQDRSKEVVAYQPGNKLVAAAAVMGAPKWSYDLGKRRFMGVLSGANGVTALGMASMEGSRVVVVGTVCGDIIVFDGRTGKKLSHKKECAGYINNLSTGDLNGDGVFDVVFSSNDHMVYALSGKDLKGLWEFRTDDEVHSSPALGDMDNDGLLDVVVVSNDDKVYCIDGETGKKIWDYEVGTDCGAGYAVLADVNGNGLVDVVVSGTLDGKLVVLETEAGCRRNEILWAKELGNNRNTGAYGEE